MGNMLPKDLIKAIDMKIFSEVFKLDLLVGLGFGAGTAWLSVKHPEVVQSALGVTASLVGVVVGSVVAGVAVLGAFMDQSFLRKMRRIDADPVRSFAPFLFTAVIGVFAAIFLLVLGVLPVDNIDWIRAIVGGLAGLFTGWTLASLIYDLDVLVQFIRLQEDAAGVADSRPEENGDDGDHVVRRLPQ